MKKLFMSGKMVSQKLREGHGKWRGKGGDIRVITREGQSTGREVLIPTGMLQAVARGVK
jgi:hypothetical protein